MKTYRVGGSVRDALLGLPVKDIDYVVTGSTPEQMVTAGFVPVGKDFPVFLHPKTHAEYALARTERKSAPGYHGFVFHCAPDVTIEEDLLRRDLTINAMAIAEDGDETDEKIDPRRGENQQQIIDPFGGQQDLAAKLFRHVSDAFSEDPVRILRVARFAARFNTFTIAPETTQLMRAMVQTGEVDALVPERVWQEIARALMEGHPSRMIEVLREAGAMSRIMPEFDAMLIKSINIDDKRIKHVVDYAATLGFSLEVRWAAMLAECNSNSIENSDADSNLVTSNLVTSNLVTQLCARLKVPSEVRDITLLVLRECVPIEHALSLEPESVVHLFERCDAFRRTERFTQVLQAVLCIHYAEPSFPQQALLEDALMVAKAIPSRKIAQETMICFPNQPMKIANAISSARIEAIRHMLKP